MISWIEEVRLDSHSAPCEKAHSIDPAFGGSFSNVGEPGADSTIIVVEKDRPSKWQRILLHLDLGLLADCKSFRTEELSRAERLGYLLAYLARRGRFGGECRELLASEGCA